jgi:hypothetical protein
MGTDHPISRGRRCALLALLLTSAVASAHRDEFPKRDRLELTPTALSLRIDYCLATSDESRLLFRLFDRDRSGQLDDPESAALLAHLARLATAFVTLEIDGRPLPLHQAAAELSGPSAASLALSAVVILTAPLGLKPGRHRLRLGDRHKDRRQPVPLTWVATGLRVQSSLPPLPLLHDGPPIELELVVDKSPGS